jgi:hypothetical protein
VDGCKGGEGLTMYPVILKEARIKGNGALRLRSAWEEAVEKI